MTTGEFGVAASTLQLFVPSYGLRLVRRFGVSRVGWFVVTSFVALAALHCLEPMGPTRSGFGPELMLNCVYAIGSVLLLIGMGHIETLFSHYDRSHSNEKSLSSNWEAKVKKETSGLMRANESLKYEVARYKQADASLRESEAQFRFVFTENPEAMWILDLQHSRFLGVNKAALRIYGFTPEEFMRLTPQDLLPPEQLDEFMAEVSRPCTRTESRARWQHYRRDQTLMDVEIAARDFTYGGSPARLVVITDISMRLRREIETFHARKMELSAQITGGVARHLGNILNAIDNRTALLRPLMNDEASAGHLQELTMAITRGNNLNFQMLAAGGQQAVQLRPLDLNRLIGNLCLALRRLCGDKVTLQNQCGPNPLPIMGDPQVLEYVMMNLIKNARDAMQETGMMVISSAIVRVEAPPIQQDPNNKEFVRLTVRDTGSGMPTEVQEHLFEPFFTTREEASGLGLAGVYGAVRQHWGWIECSTAVDSGTEFKIFLPSVSPSLLPSASESAAALDRGTVLLVDPDDRTRGVARYILNRNGYRVIEADSASIAQLLWQGQARNIDLLLTDFTLQETSGFDLANQLRQTRPDLKVIYAFVETEGNKPELPEDSMAISKPYQADFLIECVERLTGVEVPSPDFGPGGTEIIRDPTLEA